MTGEQTVKGRNLRRDPRVTMCVDDQEPPYSYVTVEGTATVSSDVDGMLPWSTRIGGRYMGEDQAEAFGRRNAVPGELLVRITPTKFIAERNVAD